MVSSFDLGRVACLHLIAMPLYCHNVRCLALLTIVQDFRTRLPSSHFPRRRAHWIRFLFSTCKIWISLNYIFANFLLVVRHFMIFSHIAVYMGSRKQYQIISLCHEHNTQHRAQSSCEFWNSFWQWIRCLSLLMDIVIIMLDPYLSGTCGTLWLVHQLESPRESCILYAMKWTGQRWDKEGFSKDREQRS